jgi:drug/metabolite transporter (DMT)-like permease
MDVIEPQNMPVEIVKRRESITLYQVAVIALAAIGLLAVIGGILLSFFDRSIPESVIVLGSVAVGALAGMVAPASVRGGE